MLDLCDVFEFVIDGFDNSRNLSDTLIIAPFMLFLSLVTNCIPSTKIRSNNFLLM